MRWPAMAAGLLGLWLGLAACAPGDPEGLRPHTYSYAVPPGRTFDLREGRVLAPERLAARLRGARLLFLGEYHTSRQGHRFQREMVELLLSQGREVTLALEMFPPSADGALERWRNGELEEADFLERSGWYRHWGFAWGYYRELFLLARRHRLPMRGINVERSERKGFAKEGRKALPPALRAEIGAEGPSPEPAAHYLWDALREAGHPGVGGADSSSFRSLRRVQWLWERTMGVRAARLAQRAGPGGIVVVLIGAGHLAYGLGANLHAARESPLPQLTVWERQVEKGSPPAAYRVPAGMADWVRIHERDPAELPIPTLRGIRLEPGTGGARVKRVLAHAGSPWAALRVGDLIRSLDGIPRGSPASLRLAFEQLTPGGTAELELLRGGETLRLSVPVEPPAHH